MTTNDPALRSTSVVAAGTTQATATVITHRFATVADGITLGAGVVLTEANCNNFGWGTIANGELAAGASESGASLLVYPWSGASFNGQAADTPLNLEAGKTCMWVYMSSTQIQVIG